jgi:hypothetical protein
MSLLISTLSSIVVYFIMYLMGDKNAMMTSVLYLAIMMSRDHIVDAIKEKKL